MYNLARTIDKINNYCAPYTLKPLNRTNIGNSKTVGTLGRLHNNTMVLKCDLVKKIMCVNKLKLPDVLIDIIKDYLYYSCDIFLHRLLTYRISRAIKNQIYKDIEYTVGEDDEQVYEYKTNIYLCGPIPYFQGQHTLYRQAWTICMCSQCGNYTNDYLYIDPCYSESLLCTCYNHPYYQEQYDIQPFYRTDVKNDIHENFVSSKNYTDI
jgi:hypothetical protein